MVFLFFKPQKIFFIIKKKKKKKKKKKEKKKKKKKRKEKKRMPYAKFPFFSCQPPPLTPTSYTKGTLGLPPWHFRSSWLKLLLLPYTSVPTS
jgi:hypothetical protein